MDSQYKEFSKYLLKFGIISKSDVLFDNLTSKKNIFSERNAIGKVKEYLLKSFFKQTKLTAICNGLYERYVDFDDESVTRIIRRLFMIYTRYHQRCLNNHLLKWKLIAVVLFHTSVDNKAFVYKKKINNIIVTDNTCSSNERKVKPSHSISVFNDKELDKQESSAFQIKIANEANFSITDRPQRNIFRRQRSYTPSLRLLGAPSIKKKRKESIPKAEHCKTLLTKTEKEELFSSLYNDSKNRREKLKQKLLEKEQSFNSLYTFTPQMATRARSSDKYRYHNETSFFERLQTFNQSRKSNLQKIEKEVIESLPKPKECKKPSEPHLITKSQDYKQVKEEKIRQIENTIRQEQGITFRPVLNDNVNAMIPHSVIERNEQFLKQKQAKLCSYRSGKECSFKPQINETSSTANRSVIAEDSTNPIGQRLYEYQSKYLQNLEEKKMQYKESFPFKPIISKNTDEILENKKKIMEELKKRYDNRMQSETIKDEASRKETDDQQVNYKLKTLNDLTENEDNRSLPIEERSGLQKKSLDKDNIDLLPSLTDEQRLQGTSTAKCESTNKNTKVTLSVENLPDDKLLELARNYISIDESLEKFQLRYKNKLGATDNKLTNKQPITFKEQETVGKNSMQQSITSLKGSKTLMQNLNYYDNLC